MIIILVLAGVILLVYFVGSRIWRECMALIQNLPDLYEELETGLRQIGDNLNVVFERLPEAVQNAWYQMIDNLDQAMGAVSYTHLVCAEIIEEEMEFENGDGWNPFSDINLLKPEEIKAFLDEYVTVSYTHLSVHII